MSEVVQGNYASLSDAATAVNQRCASGRHKSTSAPACRTLQRTSHGARVVIDASGDAAFAMPQSVTTKMATMAYRTQPAPLKATYASAVHSMMKKTCPPLLTTCSGQTIHTVSRTRADANIAAAATEITHGRTGSCPPTSLTDGFALEVWFGAMLTRLWESIYRRDGAQPTGATDFMGYQPGPQNGT